MIQYYICTANSLKDIRSMKKLLILACIAAASIIALPAIAQTPACPKAKTECCQKECNEKKCADCTCKECNGTCKDCKCTDCTCKECKGNCNVNCRTNCNANCPANCQPNVPCCNPKANCNQQANCCHQTPCRTHCKTPRCQTNHVKK